MVQIGKFQAADAASQRLVLSSDGQAIQSAKVKGRLISRLSRTSEKQKTAESNQNLAVKNAFVKSIQATYGSNVAKEVQLKLDMSGQTPLTGRAVHQILKEHVTVHRRSDSLQSGDIKMLLGRAGAIDPNGRMPPGGLLAEHLTFLSQAVQQGKPELSDKLAFASDEAITGLLADALKLDPGSDDVTRALAAVRSGAPNKMSDDGTTLTIGGREYARGQLLGVGGFGAAHVYRAENGDSVVVKTLAEPNRAEFETPRSFGAEKSRLMDGAREECKAHRYAISNDGHQDEAGSEYVAGFGGPARSPDGTIHLIIEHCSTGDVTKLWGAHGGAVSGIDQLVTDEILPQSAANKLKASLAHDLLKGMQHLQLKRNMVHLDLKPHNVFMDSAGRAKVGDFGLAQPTMTRPLERGFQTTRQYASPELFAASGARDEQDRYARASADTYSVGYMLYELVTGSRPFEAVQDMSFYTNRKAWFAAHSALAEGPQSTGNEHWDALINGLTHKDPDQRMSLDDAIKSPLFADILTGDGTDVKPEIRSLLPKIVSLTRAAAKAESEPDELTKQTMLLDVMAARYEIAADSLEIA